MGRKQKHGDRSAGTESLDGPAFGALADALPGPVLLTDPAGLPLRANRSFLERLGPAPRAGWLGLVATEDRAAAAGLWLEAGLARRPQEAVLRMGTRGGPEALRCRVTPVEAEGRLLGWAVALTETAESQAAEAGLGQAEDGRAAAERRAAEAEGRLREIEAALRAEVQARTQADALLQDEAGRRERAEAESREAQAAQRTAQAARSETELRLAEARAGLEDMREGLALAVERLEEARERMARAEARLREGEARLAQSEARRAQVAARLSEAEERARRAEEAAWAWVGAAPGLLWTALADGTPDLQSRALRDAVAGRAGGWLTLVHPEDRVRVLGLWAQAVSHGQPFEAEHRLQGPDGRYRPVLSRARPVRDGSGGLTGWVGDCVDREEAVAAQAEAAEPPAALAQARSDQGRAGEAGAPSGPAALGGEGRDSLPEPEGAKGPGANRTAFAPGEDDLDALADRLRSPELRSAVARWRAARRGARLPRFEDWAGGTAPAMGEMEAELGPDGAPLSPRVVHTAPGAPLVSALLSRAGREADGWAQAAAGSGPVRAVARIALAGRGSLRVERLVLPFSTTGGRADRAMLLLMAEEERVSRAS